MRLKTEIFLIFFTVSVAVIALSATLYYFNARNALLNQSAKQLESLSEAKTKRLNSIIDKRVEEFHRLKTLPVITQSMYDYKHEGMDVYRVLVYNTILKVKNQVSNFKSIYVVDTLGKVIVATSPEMMGKDFAHRTLFTKIYNTNKEYVEINYNNGKTVRLFISGTIIMGDEVLGALVVENDIEDVVSITNDYTGLGKTGETVLAVKREGGSAVYLTPLRFSKEQFLKIDSNSLSDDRAMKDAINGIEKVSTKSLDYRGQEILASTRHLYKTDWGLVTKIDRREALIPVNDLRNITIITSVVLLILLLVLSYKISGYIVSPVYKISETVQRITAGNLDERVDNQWTNEFGDLASAFNDMTDKLVKTQHRLHKKIADLDNTNDALNRFAYAVSHDLKSPLNTIHGLIEVFEMEYRGQIKGDGEKYLSLIKSQAQNMGNLIKGILEYSKSGDGKGNPQNVDLNQLLREVLVNIVVPNNIKVIIQDNLPSVMIDKFQVLQVYQNLISNAVKYNDKEEGIVEVGYTNHGSYNTFFVKDNGQGIDAENHEKVFDIFQKLKSIKESDSTGVGLAIVKKIIESHGGKIWLESEVGKGASFYFTLPV
jgi:signal transduction histidine kinase